MFQNSKIQRRNVEIKPQSFKAKPVWRLWSQTSTWTTWISQAVLLQPQDPLQHLHCAMLCVHSTPMVLTVDWKISSHSAKHSSFPWAHSSADFPRHKKKKVRRVSSLLPRWTKPYRWMKNIIFTSVLYHCQTELVICPTFLRPRAGLEDVAVKWQVGQEGNTLAATAMQQQPLPAELTAPKRRRQMSGRFNPSSWVTVPLDGRLGFVTAHIAFFLLYTAPGMDSPSTSSFHWFLRSILRIILLHCIA